MATGSVALDGDCNKESAEDALGNYLILEEIFRNLSHKDLLVCGQVNYLWKSIVDPMICHYIVSLDTRTWEGVEDPDEELGNIWAVAVKRFSGFDGQAQIFTTDFNGLMDELRNTRARGKKMSIDLEINNMESFYSCTVTSLEFFLPFLPEFGETVQSFDCHIANYCCYDFNFGTYCLYLSYFPNLEALKCNFFDDSYENDDTQGAPRPLLSCLKQICVGRNLKLRHWNHILQMAPNVEEILGFPVQFAGTLWNAGKQGALKSIRYRYSGDFHAGESDDEFDPTASDLHDARACLQRLANMDVQLTSLSIPDFHAYYDTSTRGTEEDTIEFTRTILHRILESSRSTLTFLTVQQGSYVDSYFPLPFPLPKVKILKFDVFPPRVNGPRQEIVFGAINPKMLFSKKFDLESTFPNLKGLEISNIQESCDMNLCSPQDVFPFDTFGTDFLGERIKSLETHEFSPAFIEHFATLFPSVTDLSIEVTTAEFEAVLPAVADRWSHLEVFTVFLKCDDCGEPWVSVDGGSPVEPTQASMEGYKGILKAHFRDIVTLCIHGLKKLEFVFQISTHNSNKCHNHIYYHIPLTLLSRTEALAFEQFGLEVLVGVPRQARSEVLEAIQDALEPQAQNIRLDSNYVRPCIPCRYEGWLRPTVCDAPDEY